MQFAEKFPASVSILPNLQRLGDGKSSNHAALRAVENFVQFSDVDGMERLGVQWPCQRRNGSQGPHRSTFGRDTHATTRIAYSIRGKHASEVTHTSAPKRTRAAPVKRNGFTVGIEREPLPRQPGKVDTSKKGYKPTTHIARRSQVRTKGERNPGTRKAGFREGRERRNVKRKTQQATATAASHFKKTHTRKGD